MTDRGPNSTTAPARVLAVASGGGHWTELQRVIPAFEEGEIIFLTVNRAYVAEAGGRRCVIVKDATRWSRLSLIWMALRIFLIVLRLRPQVVVTTGAAPGYFALRAGRLLGARTIWVDSIANVDRLSLSGALAGRYADLWLTQWPHLANSQGPEYSGTVL